MKSKVRSACCLPLLALGLAAAGAAPEALPNGGDVSLVFADKVYLHRWSKDDQHEFTPRGQEDLQRWTDMITINYYRNARDGEDLAAVANSVLGNYQRNRAQVLKTSSVPRSAQKPAEYLIVVLFPQPEFIEAVFSRFKLVGGTGTAAIYCHREYGKQIGDQMSAWLQKNDAAIEKALMAWERIPPFDAQK